jgi:hypothetical protein
MSGVCGYGQIPDLRFRTLCCNGRIVIDENCDLFVESLFLNDTLTVGVGGNVNFPGTNIDLRSSIVDFAGSTVLNLDGNISGNIIAGTITGNLVQTNIFGNLIGDVFGDVFGDLRGDLLGNVRGNILANVVLINELAANAATIGVLNSNIINANTLVSDLCIDPGASLIFKTGSELSGNICIPSGSTINFKDGSTVIIDTAFGTSANGDILVHQGSKTVVLNLGPTGHVLQSDGTNLVYSDDLCIDEIKANVVNTDVLNATNLAIATLNFDVLTANVIVANDVIQVLAGGNLVAPAIFGNLVADDTNVTGNLNVSGKLVANLCGNLIATETIVEGDFVVPSDNTFTISGGNVTVDQSLIVCDTVVTDFVKPKSRPEAIAFFADGEAGIGQAVPTSAPLGSAPTLLTLAGVLTTNMAPPPLGTTVIIPVGGAGVYRISFYVNWEVLASGILPNSYTCTVLVNGAVVGSMKTQDSFNTIQNKDFFSQSYSIITPLVPLDTISFEVDQDTGVGQQIQVARYSVNQIL